MDTCVNCARPSEILKGELCQGCLSEFFVITNKERSKFVVMSQMYYYGRKLDRLTNLHSIFSGTQEKCREAVKELKPNSEIII